MESQYRVWNDEVKMKSALENFLAEKPKKKKWGNFKITEGNKNLVYQTKSGGSWEHSEGEVLTNTIATRLPNGKVLGNASILPLVGRYVSYGNETVNRTVTVIQNLMETHPQYELIPFSVFDEAELRLDSYNEVDNTGEETVTREMENPKYKRWESARMAKENIPANIVETVHFTGARLFSVKNKEDKELKFLFDIDRGEIEHKIFNPFLVQVPENGTPINTVPDAYSSLMPNEVKYAIAKGLNVKRQGEWFFIPSDKSPEEKLILSDAEKRDMGLAVSIQNLHKPYGDQQNAYTQTRELLGNEEFDRLLNLVVPNENAIRMKLQAGKNRPNYAQFGLQKDGLSYVKGEISHSGREHKTIVLDNWHIAMPNTAIDSFTITGDID